MKTATRPKNNRCRCKRCLIEFDAVWENAEYCSKLCRNRDYDDLRRRKRTAALFKKLGI